MKNKQGIRPEKERETYFGWGAGDIKVLTEEEKAEVLKTITVDGNKG